MLRSRRFALLALTVIVVAGAMAMGGCGGDEETPSTTTTAPGGGGGGSATTVTGSGGVGPFAALIGTALQVTQDTPPEVADAVEQHRPVVVLFYVPGNVDDGAVLDSLTKLQSTYTDVTFVFYDYKMPAAYGDLGQSLKVGYTPQAVFINTRGVIQDVTSGYVDEDTLNQAVVNIRQG